MKTVFNVMLLLVVIVSATAFSSCKEKRGELKKIWYNGSYNRDFNDLNDVHLSVAKKIGIEPVSSREGAEHASRDMVEIKTNDYYEVEELTHSIPYLVPEAANLLEDIGKNFQDSLKNLNASIYKINQCNPYGCRCQEIEKKEYELFSQLCPPIRNYVRCIMGTLY